MANENNNKMIQILRGDEEYLPSESTVELADGQPFYSKSNQQLYIGNGGAIKDTNPVGASNLRPGESGNSVEFIHGGAKAEHDNSMALGLGTTTGKDGQVVIGNYNVKEDDSIFVVGNGKSDSERSTAIKVSNQSTTVNTTLDLPNLSYENEVCDKIVPFYSGENDYTIKSVQGNSYDSQNLIPFPYFSMYTGSGNAGDEKYSNSTVGSQITNGTFVYPYKVNRNGVTFTVYEDGRIHVSSTSDTASAHFVLFNTGINQQDKRIPLMYGVDYLLSGVDGGSDKTYYLQAFYNCIGGESGKHGNTNTSYPGAFYRQDKDSYTPWTGEYSAAITRVVLFVKGKTDTTIYPMLHACDKIVKKESFVGNQATIDGNHLKLSRVADNASSAEVCCYVPSGPNEVYAKISEVSTDRTDKTCDLIMRFYNSDKSEHFDTVFSSSPSNIGKMQISSIIMPFDARYCQLFLKGGDGQSDGDYIRISNIGVKPPYHKCNTISNTADFYGISHGTNSTTEQNNVKFNDATAIRIHSAQDFIDEDGTSGWQLFDDGNYGKCYRGEVLKLYNKYRAGKQAYGQVTENAQVTNASGRGYGCIEINKPGRVKITAVCRNETVDDNDYNNNSLMVGFLYTDGTYSTENLDSPDSFTVKTTYYQGYECISRPDKVVQYIHMTYSYGNTMLVQAFDIYFDDSYINNVYTIPQCVKLGKWDSIVDNKIIRYTSDAIDLTDKTWSILNWSPDGYEGATTVIPYFVTSVGSNYPSDTSNDYIPQNISEYTTKVTNNLFHAIDIYKDRENMFTNGNQYAIYITNRGAIVVIPPKSDGYVVGSGNQSTESQGSLNRFKWWLKCYQNIGNPLTIQYKKELPEIEYLPTSNLIGKTIPSVQDTQVNLFGRTNSLNNGLIVLNLEKQSFLLGDKKQAVNASYVSNQLSNLNNNLSNKINSVQSILSQDIDEIKDSVGISGGNNISGNLTDRVEVCEDNIDTLSSDLSSLTRSVGTLVLDVNELTGRTHDAQLDIQGLQTTAEDLQTDVSTLQSNVNNITSGATKTIASQLELSVGEITTANYSIKVVKEYPDDPAANTIYFFVPDL